jgi:enoyl-CoA hydratase/carnithine racemase
MPQTHLIDIETRGRVLELTLNRADKRNALNHEMCIAIVDACESANADPHIGAILWKSQGPVFSAGMDLDEAVSPQSFNLTAVHASLFSLGARLTKPIVCAVQGPALGGGLGLVLNSHVALTVHGATFGLTEIRIGMWPYTIYRAAERAFGPRRALELTLTSKIFNTPEALAWGLVQEVVPPFELDDRAGALAQMLASASAETIERGMRFVQASEGQSDARAMQLALLARDENFRSLDFDEGVRAFRDKRPPRWPSQP